MLLFVQKSTFGGLHFRYLPGPAILNDDDQQHDTQRKKANLLIFPTRSKKVNE